jgi:hypothetical protein
MKALVLLTLLFTSYVHAFELKLGHPFYLPNFLGATLGFEAGAGHRDIDYSTNESIITEESYKYNEVHISGLLSPWQDFAIGTYLHYDFDREYELRYGPSSTNYGQQPYNSSASGPLDPEIILIYQFHSRKDSWNQQFLIQGNPFDIEEKPRSIFRGGHDFLIEYRFSHQYDIGALYSSLFSQYFGKKDFFLPGDPRPSVSEAYTEVGILLGFLYRHSDKWSFTFDGTFALSSDYVVRTPELTRYADKGFLLYGSLSAMYFVQDNSFIKFKTWAGSRVYNATQEELNRDIDYEIEDLFYLISYVYNWDSLL